MAAESDANPETVKRLEAEMREYLKAVEAEAEGADSEPTPYRRDLDRLRLAVIAEKRATVIRLRNQRRIDDAVLRRMQAAYDLEEIRILDLMAEED